MPSQTGVYSFNVRRFKKAKPVQIAESLISDYKRSCNTLHLDGTPKFGKHYESYNLVTGKGKYLTTGIQETDLESTETQPNVLIDIIKEFEELLNKSEYDVSKKLCLK